MPQKSRWLWKPLHGEVSIGSKKRKSTAHENKKVINYKIRQFTHNATEMKGTEKKNAESCKDD